MSRVTLPRVTRVPGVIPAEVARQRGAGARPREYGLDLVLAACTPRVTCHVSRVTRVTWGGLDHEVRAVGGGHLVGGLGAGAAPAVILAVPRAGPGHAPAADLGSRR